MELLLIRHGLPLARATEDGSPADPPLSREGQAQAAAVARWLADERIDCLYASPLQRARETAAPLSEHKALPVQIEAGVTEYDGDSDSYVPLEQLKREDYEAWQRFMQEGYIDLLRFSEVVVGSLEGVIARHRGERVAVVCHGGVINAWTAHVLGMEPRLFFEPTYTSVNRYLAASSGERAVVTLNEAAHLRRLDPPAKASP